MWFDEILLRLLYKPRVYSEKESLLQNEQAILLSNVMKYSDPEVSCPRSVLCRPAGGVTSPDWLQPKSNVYVYVWSDHLNMWP